MSKTTIETARAAGTLLCWFDFRAGVLTDQSGNGHTLVLPSDADLSRQGLRCFTEPAYIALDMSSVKGFWVACLVSAHNYTVATDQHMLELTTDAESNAGGWKTYQKASGGYPWSYFLGSSGACDSAPLYTKKTTQDMIYHCTMDRRLSSNCVDSYLNGRNDNTGQHDNNTDDGSGFANSNLYIAGRGGTNDNIHRGLIKAFGIIDFTAGSTPTPLEHAKLYSEIRDWETV